MYTITDKSTKKNTTIHCTGPLKGESSEVLKDALMTAFNKAAPVVILNLNEVEALDLSGLQVIISAWKTAKALGKKFVLAEAVPDRIKQQLTVIGCSALIAAGHSEGTDGD